MARRFDVSQKSKLTNKERWEWNNPQKLFEQADVKPGGYVADLGCGVGFFTLPLLDLMKDDGRIYAVDISRELIHDLAERVDPRGEKNVVPILADMSKVPLPNASMTLIIFVNVYHEFEDRASGLAELCRLMKKDGRLLFVEWRTDQDQKGPPMEERVSREEARDDLKRAGLKILKELQPGPYQYGFLLEKRFN